VAVTSSLVARGIKAGDIANAIAVTTGGKGGGRPEFASAGVGDASKMGQARAQTASIVRELLKR
jgi:alanyl-tRNA synthetase